MHTKQCLVQALGTQSGSNESQAALGTAHPCWRNRPRKLSRLSPAFLSQDEAGMVRASSWTRGGESQVHTRVLLHKRAQRFCECDRYMGGNWTSEIMAHFIKKAIGPMFSQ